MICAQGRMDMRGILQSVTRKDYMRFQMWMAEKVNKEMREESFKTGKNIKNQMTFIADMEHLSMRQMTYRPGSYHKTDTTRKIFDHGLIFKRWKLGWNKQKFMKLIIQKIFAAFLSSMVV